MAKRRRGTDAYNLGERVKELTALHETARIVQDPAIGIPDLIARIAALLPPAFQYPDVTVAAVEFGDARTETPGYRDSPWALETTFVAYNGTRGQLRVVYLKKKPESAEGPFLAEERRLLDSLGEILRAALDRRGSENELRGSRERLTLAQEAAGMGVWEWDFASNRVTWTEVLERIIGLEPGTFEGTYDAFQKRIHPDDISSVQAALERAMRNPDAGYAVELRMLRPDGEARCIMATGRIMRDASGRPAGMLGMAHDVTQLRQLEQQLRQSLKMEALGKLAGGVAHDFNNLLTAIKGYSEFVADALEPGDSRRKDVEEISAAAERAAGLTRQLLAFSRHQVLSPKVIDANTVVSDIERLLSRLIGGSIELRVSLSSDTASIHVDPGQLEQVLVNLVVNARDAMPSGGLLTISTSIGEPDAAALAASADLTPGRYVVISVRDTGTGMTAETKARMFEPFFTTKEVGRGTGLGLATVYGIVRQSGGAITVESDVGVGTKFDVHFPWISSAVEAVAPAPSPATSPRGTERLLFVDDDEQVRALARRAFAANGYDAIIAASGDEALRAVDARVCSIDLLVTDIVMPRMRGPELFARVREKSPNVRVIYITGFTTSGVDVAVSAATVLHKPFTPAGLLRTVRGVLDAA